MQCHAHMHGLIHDGRLWACSSCLLGLICMFVRLMCVHKWLYVIRYLGFQLWWLYKKATLYPSPLVFLKFLCMRAISIFYLDFLDAHSGYYTAIVYIQLHSFFAILFNSRKTLFLVCFMLKTTNFLCFWNSWVVATRVVAVGRSALLLLLLVLLEGALCFLQPTKLGQTKSGH